MFFGWEKVRLGGAKPAPAKKIATCRIEGMVFGVYSTMLENAKWKFQVRRQNEQ
jgi:hypothetical protein